MLVIRKAEEEPREKRRVVDQEDRRGTERKREGGRVSAKNRHPCRGQCTALSSNVRHTWRQK